MKTKYKYIHFDLIKELPKTFVIGCYANALKVKLGEVKWYPAWRQYCFFPEPETVFNISCLEDICHFIKQLEKERAK